MIAFLALGSLLSVAFALAAVALREILEDRIIGGTLAREISAYAQGYRDNPAAPGIPFSKIRGWVFAQRNFDRVPEAWAELPNGVHRIVEEEAGELVAYQLAVLKEPDVWFFLRYDVSQEERTRRLTTVALWGVALLFSALSLLLGIWSASRVMSPVTDLAHRIRRLGQRGAPPQRLAPDFADDEVGQVAQALDDYAQRLTRLVERDREFNSDVSHELRTPLAVIQSTTELLLAMPDLPERARERLKRIERAAKQSTELTTALLHLSRGEKQAPSDGEYTAVETLIGAIVDAHRGQLRGKPITVRLDVRDSVHVPAPEAVVSVVLGNLIGNAFKYTREGTVEIKVQDGAVSVEDTGPGIPESDLLKVFERHYRGAGGGSGAGLGLAIVKRLCELYGWRVSLQARTPHGVRAELDFGRLATADGAVETRATELAEDGAVRSVD